MRIRTQFKITMLLFGVILAILAVSTIITTRRAEKASEQEKIATGIAEGASELSYLANDYLIYRESQQLRRWQSRFASFSTQVASLQVDKPDQQTLVRNIQANEKRLKEVFDGTVSAVGNLSPSEGGTLDRAFFQVSWSRIAVQSQGLVSDALRLSQMLRAQVIQLRQMRTMLNFVMLGVLGAFLLSNYIQTFRRTLKSMATLQAGTTIIGSGNLDFRIEEKKNDEIGDLSHAFNQMTTSLKTVTASKADLEREITERKWAEEELRKQREWLRVTLSSIGDGVIATDKEGRITFLNPVAATLTGWQPEEALNLPINSVFRIINEKTREPALDLVAEVLGEKCVVALANDTALVTKYGHEIPIEDSAAPILDAAENLTGVVLVFHDVTQKRQTQRVLREALERAVWLARFPDENPNPVLRVSFDGNILYRNQATCGAPGWACEIGQPLPSTLMSLVAQALTEERQVEQELELSGKFYLTWVTPFPEEAYANIYARDITERKRADEALRESELRLEANLDAMTRLQKIGTLFLSEGNLESILTEIVDAAIATSGANFGNVQLLDPESLDLKIVAQRGFPKWWLDFWNSVSRGKGACGTALERGERVIVEDVEQSPIFVGTPALEIQLKAGVRALQSTPLVSRSGKPLGMFSTHYKTPHRPEDRTLGLLDLLARQTADIIERAQAEESLRDSEERFRAVFESSSDCILVWDRQYNYLYANQAAIDHVGTTRDKVIGKNMRDGLGHLPDFMRLWMGRVDRAFATGESFRVEDAVPVGDRLIHSESQISPIRDAVGQVFAVGVVYRDVTERKRAEEALRESEAKYRELVQNANSAIIRWKSDGTVTFFNEFAQAFFGYTPDEIIGRHVGILVPEKDSTGGDLGTLVQDIVDYPDRYVQNVNENICRDGRRVWLAWTNRPIFDDQGRVAEILAVGTDITERRRMEEELRQSEEKSRLLIKYAPSMFYEIDFHGPAFKSVNDIMCQLLGYTREELLAINPFDLLDDEGKALFRDRIRRKFAGEDISDSVEYKGKAKDAREIYGILNLSFTYKDGKPDGAIVVAHDITERKRAEEALKQRASELHDLTVSLGQRVHERTEALEETNKALRQLSIRLLSAQEEERKRVAGEIHDSMGSCLSGIKFRVESALDEIAKTPKAAAQSLSTIVPMIREAIEECRRIQMDLRPSMLDDLGLLPTLSWFFRRFQTIYPAIHLEHKTTVEESEFPDSLKIVIYRVIQEAMNNAAKHSKADLVRISLRKVHNKMELFIEDNGRGFSVQQRLFQTNTNRGLGLTSMRERTELSGGSFAVESAEGKGTVIYASWSL